MIEPGALCAGDDPALLPHVERQCYSSPFEAGPDIAIQLFPGRSAKNPAWLAGKIAAPSGIAFPHEAKRNPAFRQAAANDCFEVGFAGVQRPILRLKLLDLRRQTGAAKEIHPQVHAGNSVLELLWIAQPPVHMAKGGWGRLKREFGHARLCAKWIDDATWLS